MPKTMKAAVVERLGQPLVIREVPVADAGPGQATHKGLKESEARPCQWVVISGRA